MVSESECLVLLTELIWLFGHRKEGGPDEGLTLETSVRNDVRKLIGIGLRFRMTWPFVKRRAGERLTLETSTFETLYGGQISC